MYIIPAIAQLLMDSKSPPLQQKFMDKYKKEIEKFGFYSNWDDSKEYLLANPHLACEDTANYLTYWCVNLQMEEVCMFVSLYVRQSVCSSVCMFVSRFFRNQ